MDAPARRPALRPIAFSVLLTLGLLAALEGALRLAGAGPPPLPSPFPDEPALGAEGSGTLPDRELFYRLRPSIDFLGYYRLNALGYRGPEVPRERTPGTLRIACAGDSSTFGLGVPEARAWPFVLQRLLEAAAGRPVEVIDAGVPGYTSAQNRVQVERDLLALQPDALLLLPMGHNDDARVAGRDDAEALAFRRGFGFTLSRLALPAALGLRLDATTPADAGVAVDAVAAGGLLRPRVPLPALEDNLRAIAAACGAAGVPLLLVAPPHDEPVRRQRPGELAAEELVLRLARELRLPLADPRAALDALAPRPLYTDTVHPNADGHALIAWHAFAALVREVDLPWDAGTRDFARAWVDARERGLDCAATGAALYQAAGPPAYRELHAALAAPDIDARLAAGSAAPPALAEHDPLFGARASPLDVGRHMLLDLQDPGSVQDGAAHLARRDLLDAVVRPPSALRQVFFSPFCKRPMGTWTDESWELEVRTARALVAFEGALDLACRPQDTRLYEAQRLSDLSSQVEALALIEQVLELQPRSAEALAVRGQCRERLGDRAGAQADFEAGAALEPDSATGLFLLARTRLQRGETAAADEALQRVLELDPAHKLARLARVHALLRLDRPDEAERQLAALQRVGAGTLADIPSLKAAIEQKRAALAAPR